MQNQGNSVSQNIVPEKSTWEMTDSEMIQLYLNWNYYVRKIVPAEKLLEYNVKQGIEPLQTFLEVSPDPPIKMPFINAHNEFDVLTQLVKFTAVVQIAGYTGLGYTASQKIRGKIPKRPVVFGSLAALFGPAVGSLIVAKISGPNGLIPFLTDR